LKKPLIIFLRMIKGFTISLLSLIIFLSSLSEDACVCYFKNRTKRYYCTCYPKGQKTKCYNGNSNRVVKRRQKTDFFLGLRIVLLLIIIASATLFKSLSINVISTTSIVIMYKQK